MRSPGTAAGILTIVSGCVLFSAPTTPDPGLLGCYRLETSLQSYADSLGYELPSVLQLGYSEHGQWTVLPTDPEWHPDWTIYDDLPSGYVRRRAGAGATGPLQWDSVSRIPGDSFDVRFPSALGTLVVRLGGGPERFGGRAEWGLNQFESLLNEGARVEAFRDSCSGLEGELRRTRSAGGGGP